MNKIIWILKSILFSLLFLISIDQLNYYFNYANLIEHYKFINDAISLDGGISNLLLQKLQFEKIYLIYENDSGAVGTYFEFYICRDVELLLDKKRTIRIKSYVLLGF